MTPDQVESLLARSRPAPLPAGLRDQVLETLERRPRVEERPVRGSHFSRRIAVAAAIVVVATIGAWLIGNPFSKEVQVAASILPADRSADWRPGASVGVPGGIPHDRTRLIDVTKPPFGADPTGATDAQPAIVAAIQKAAENDVVYLPAGTYRLDRPIGVGVKSRITIRGAGPDKTLLLPNPGSNGAIDIGGGGADWWYENRLKLGVGGHPAKGATVLTVADPKALDAYPNGGLGMIVQLSLKNDPKLPVIAPANFEYMRRQNVRIVKKSTTTVTVAPPLLYDLPDALFPMLAPAGRQADFVGVEDLCVDGAKANVQVGIRINQGFGCWLKNVTVLNITNYHVSIADSLQCEIRHCWVARRKGAGSNGAGVLVGTCSSCLFEDNVLVEQFPHFEVNASSGNVIAYNYCHDSSIQGMLGCSIDSNHGAHCSFNLYEGNVAQRFQSDGYHGGASHDTAFRNWFHGTSDKVTEFWVCVNLNRFTRDYSVIGNVLGKRGYPWIYDNADKGFGYDQHLIYALGMPGMGNGGFSGFAQPSKGKPWADWEKMLSAPRGKGPGPNGFQELDLDVRATTLIKGNYNFKDNGVNAGEAMAAPLPKSLYLKEKPAWFGDLAWPPIGPDVDFEKNSIPAQIRFESSK